MAAGVIGSVWEQTSWADDAWEWGSWWTPAVDVDGVYTVGVGATERRLELNRTNSGAI